MVFFFWEKKERDVIPRWSYHILIIIIIIIIWKLPKGRKKVSLKLILQVIQKRTHKTFSLKNSNIELPESLESF